jgi:DNA-binding NarL/FixJ family response regulator
MVAAAVTALMARLTVVDPVVAGAVFPARPRPPEEDLTAREREVLSLVAEGLPNKAIALRLGISDHTVKFHINAILSKLGVQSRTEAVVRAVRLGVLVL